MRNWFLAEPTINSIDNFAGSFTDIWRDVRVLMVIPPLAIALYICVVMPVMMFIERVYMTVVVMLVKIMGKKRYTRYKLEALKEDLEQNRRYPMVLVQIPMYNEKEVYKLSIGSVCSLTWPSDRLIVQVLDDSTNQFLRKLVESECKRWIERGVNVKYETRNNRNGYKAGALREGLNKDYVTDCEFVVIFNADFQPDKDFLWRSVPYLLENPELALVQARWKFVNANECIMTRLQEMSLAYHFAVEQEVGSSTCQFFGFNGTAGVWRIKAIEDACGWKDRTTVEDMDLAVRASLKGWKFLFVGDLEVKNELPSTFKAYRYQQHRWSCGPANLFKKMFKEIIMCERVSLYKRFHVLYAFFFVRKIIAHWVTFFFYCVVIPITIIVPEVKLPKPIAIYIPATITILNSACTIRSLHLIVPWILFENVMSFHRSNAAIIGLLGANRVNEWVVTEKLGNSSKSQSSISRPPPSTTTRTARSRLGERLQFAEVIMGVCLAYIACYDMIYGRDNMYIYLLLQSCAFFVVGVGYVGISIPPPTN